MLTLTIKTLEQLEDEQIVRAGDPGMDDLEAFVKWFWATTKADIRDKMATGEDPGRTHGCGWGHNPEAIKMTQALPDYVEVAVEFEEAFDCRFVEAWGLD